MLSNERKDRNRKTLGAILKEKREQEQLTQKELAQKVGLEYYTMISQMELGYISIPPALWVSLAEALKMPPEEWVVRCSFEIYPGIVKALFGKKSRAEVIAVLRLMGRGQLDEQIKKEIKEQPLLD